MKKFQLTEFAAEVVVYFEKHKLLEVVSRLCAEIGIIRPRKPKQWIAENIGRIAREIYKNCLQHHYNKATKITFYQPPGCYLPRVVIFGRRGSGRKTQARAISRHFGILYSIDAEQTVYQYMKRNNNFANELKNALNTNDESAKSTSIQNIIYDRLIQTDTLHRGWVLVNFPNNLLEFCNVFEKWTVTPNKLVYLQCPELIATRRIIQNPSLGTPQSNYEITTFERLHYKRFEESIHEYLMSRYETICIDSTASYESVKTNVLAQLQQRPYLQGNKM